MTKHEYTRQEIGFMLGVAQDASVTLKQRAIFAEAAPAIIAQLLDEVDQLRTENEERRVSRDGMRNLAIDVLPYIDPVNRQLANFIEGVRAQQRDADEEVSNDVPDTE